MDVYGNKRELFTIALNGFAKSDYSHRVTAEINKDR